MVQHPHTGTSPPVADAQQPFDVFLSHSRRDSDVVERLAFFLKRARVEPWLDRWCLTPGRSWQEEMAAGLAASRACAVFIGDGDVGAWVREEVELAMDLAVNRPGFRVFPVLLPGVDPLASGALPPFLGSRMWVDMRDGPTDPRGREQLLAAIRGTPFGPSAPIEPREDIVPYRGLRAFEEADSAFFFGRERDVQRLVERLRGARFVALLGASGSGKSSLARAGLVPALRAGSVRGSETWPIAVVRPGFHPVEALASAVVAFDASLTMERVVDDLTRGERGLHLATQYLLADRPPDERAVVVVDQLEEAFTLCDDVRERDSAFDNLVYAATRPGGRCVVIVTLRADFYARLAEHPPLAQLVESGHELVGPLGDEGLCQAIEGPARVAGWSVEDGLAAAIIDDAGHDPGALPLLEHALLETWRRRHAGALTLAGYLAGGGVQGALAARAEAVYGVLDADQRELARRLLLRLTQPGDGVADTRRRAPMGELVAVGRDRETVEEVIDRFTSERLLTASRDEADAACIEVAHEALIRGWPRLQAWIDDSRVALMVQRRLTEAAEDWERSGRDPSTLYTGTRLARAAEATTDALDLTEREREFLVASRSRERGERRARRLRRTIVAGSLAVGLVAAGAFIKPAAEEYFLRHQAAELGPTVSFSATTATLGGHGPEGRATVRRVFVAAFALDRHEVTNGQYRLCIRARRCSPPLEPATAKVTFDQLDDLLPVVNVTVRQATVFCGWIGRRLPTEAEWERAARGSAGRKWPWGTASPSRERVNALSERRRPPPLVPVDDARFGRGGSPEGVTHLVGNVREYTSTPMQCGPDPYSCPTRWGETDRSIPLASRGGGVEEPPVPVDGADALAVDPSVVAEQLGFRCAGSD